MTAQRARTTPVGRGPVAQPNLVLLPPPAASPLAELLALLGGEVVRVEQVDLVELANEEYEGLDPDVDVETCSAARIALDDYLYAVAVQRRVGGPRARGMHHDLCRYLLPFLLEWRAADHGPLRVDRLKTSDLDRFAQTLAGEKSLPAATVVADMLGRDRLGLTCHWLVAPEVEQVTGMPWREVTAVVPVHRDALGRELVRAMDLRNAGLLLPVEQPKRHGLSKNTAENILALARSLWERAVNVGVELRGNPKSVLSKAPLVDKRQREPRATARVWVPLERCYQIAAALHPVHQVTFWALRLAGLRESEWFGLYLSDWSPGWLHPGHVGGRIRDVRDERGQLVRAEIRAGTKGSVEGTLAVGRHEQGIAAGVLHRRLAIAPSLDRLIAYTADVFHGEAPPADSSEPRLLPGLQNDDCSGSAAFGSALTQACLSTAEQAGAHPVMVTPHDLRASLNTDLENADVDDRWLRHYFGHQTEGGKKLDVHDANYDLGLGDEQLQQVAVIIESLLPADRRDLRITTNKLPQWGRGTRQAARRNEVEGRWLADGWYRPSSETALTGPTLTLKVAADKLDLSTSQLKRLLDEGRVEGVKVEQGKRKIWAVPVAEIERVKARRRQTTLPELARQLGKDRHALWLLVGEMGMLGAGRLPGERVYLSDEQVSEVERELDRRAAAAAHAVPVSVAAARLGLTEGVVQTLVRQGELIGRPRSADSRLTQVLVDSLVDYELRHLRQPAIEPEEPLVALTDVRHVLGESRHAVSHLICARELAVTWVNRRQHVGVRSLQRYLDRHPRPGAAGRLAMVVRVWP